MSTKKAIFKPNRNWQNTWLILWQQLQPVKEFMEIRYPSANFLHIRSEVIFFFFSTSLSCWHIQIPDGFAVSVKRNFLETFAEKKGKIECTHRHWQNFIIYLLCIAFFIELNREAIFSHWIGGFPALDGIMIAPGWMFQKLTDLRNGKIEIYHFISFPNISYHIFIRIERDHSILHSIQNSNAVWESNLNKCKKLNICAALKASCN